MHAMNWICISNFFLYSTVIKNVMYTVTHTLLMIGEELIAGLSHPYLLIKLISFLAHLRHTGDIYVHVSCLSWVYFKLNIKLIYFGPRNVTLLYSKKWKNSNSCFVFKKWKKSNSCSLQLPQQRALTVSYRIRDSALWLAVPSDWQVSSSVSSSLSSDKGTS